MSDILSDTGDNSEYSQSMASELPYGDSKVLEKTMEEIENDIEETRDLLLLIQEEKISSENLLRNEEKELLTTTEEIERLKKEVDKLCDQRKDKRELIKNYEKSLTGSFDKMIDQMGQFLERIPKFNSKLEEPRDAGFLSLAEIIEKLFSKWITDPTDPYIEMDNTIWKNHVEFLYRTNIIQVKANHNGEPQKLCLQSYD